MTATDEKNLTELRTLSDQVETLNSAVTAILDNTGNYATTDDLSTITGMINSDRESLGVRVRGLVNTALKTQTVRKADLDDLRVKFTNLERLFTDFQAKLTARLNGIERKQEHSSGRLDDVSTKSAEALRMAQEALRIAQAAQATADGAQQGVDGLTLRVVETEKWGTWTHTNLFDEEGNPILPGIAARLDEHDNKFSQVNEALTNFGKRLEHIWTALSPLLKQVRDGNFFPLWTIVLLLALGFAGWAASEGPVAMLMMTALGVIVGGVVGLIIDLVMNRRKNKKAGLYRNSKSSKETTA